MKQKLLEIVRQASRRIENIVNALDQHARPADVGNSAPSDVEDGLEATLCLLEHRLGETRVHRAYETRRRVAVPAGPANQVFLNLLDNAIRSGAKNIWVATGEQNGHVVVRVGDDGPGVPVEIREKIFDAFYTTRDPGQGTGLGLHLSRAIVMDHGGRLLVNDRPGGGAEFVLEWPAAP